MMYIFMESKELIYARDEMAQNCPVEAPVSLAERTRSVQDIYNT
jgi:hypothetical protein